MGKFKPLSAIQNQPVVDPAGEHVGHVHDVLLDLRDGRIEYICIALGDGEAPASTEAVVPWSALEVDSAGEATWKVAAGRSVLEAISQPVSSRR